MRIAKFLSVRHVYFVIICIKRECMCRACWAGACGSDLILWGVSHPLPYSWWEVEVMWEKKWGKNWLTLTAAAAKSLQSCPTLCDPRDGSPLGSPIPGILQARTLEWVAISFSNAWKWKAKVKSLSRVRLFVTPRIAAHQASPSMGFSRQEYWSGVPLPSPIIL